jgi:hypothetical protein
MTIDEFRRRPIALLQQASALLPGDILHELDVESESLRGQVIRARIDHGDPAASGHGMNFQRHTMASTS